MPVELDLILPLKPMLLWASIFHQTGYIIMRQFVGLWDFGLKDKLKESKPNWPSYQQRNKSTKPKKTDWKI